MYSFVLFFLLSPSVLKKMETALDENQDKGPISGKENPFYGAEMNFSTSGRYDFQTSGKYHKITTVIWHVFEFKVFDTQK